MRPVVCKAFGLRADWKDLPVHQTPFEKALILVLMPSHSRPTHKGSTRQGASTKWASPFGDTSIVTCLVERRLLVFG